MSEQRQRSYRKVATTIVFIAAVSAGARVMGGADHDDRDDRSAARQGHAKNVILFLGDGMGDSEITVARNYEKGANGRLWMDTLPAFGEYTTYALQESNPALIDYVTDSAASGTGWATGYKTSNGRISSIAGTATRSRASIRFSNWRSAPGSRRATSARPS
jgi:alkaline phosphatase